MVKYLYVLIIEEIEKIKEIIEKIWFAYYFNIIENIQNEKKFNHNLCNIARKV